ncbi:MAG: hypothetical protein EZS28_042748, partial [Streblomastix strix]
PIVCWFWEIVRNDMNDEDRSRLLRFATGSSSPPSNGFSCLMGADGYFFLRQPDQQRGNGSSGGMERQGIYVNGALGVANGAHLFQDEDEFETRNNASGINLREATAQLEDAQGDNALTMQMKPFELRAAAKSLTAEHLPIAHTCFNIVDLPPYKSKNQLYRKLKVAIRANYFSIL